MKAKGIWIIVGVIVLGAALINIFLAIAKEGPEKWLPHAGKQAEPTLRAYYYYKDRGQFTKLREIVTKESLTMVPAKDGPGMSERAQKARGIVIDHADVGENQATLYFRSWFSRAAALNGGRPYVGRLIKEDGAWKVDIPTTLQLTLALEKGKTNLGFYDGTKEWWK